MADIVLIVLVIALILAVVLRQIKSDGYLILPKVEDGKFQLNALFYIIVGVMFGIPIIGQVYPTITSGDTLTLLLGFGIVFTSIYGTSTLVDAAGTAVTPTPEPEELEEPVDYI
jgi:hypothetical protein